MKYVLLILVILSVSCSKDSGYCWECEVNCNISQPGGEYTTTVCLDNPDDVPHFGPDANGNDCISYCQRK